MGMAVGSRFEELKAILDAAAELPLGICLDTAHAFHAGYDILNEAGLERMIAALDGTVGLGRLGVLHVNDSKTEFGSRVDRHEHIGRGKIGAEALRRLLNHPKLGARPPMGRPGRAFLLETPIDTPGDDGRNVRRLWGLVGVRAKQARKAEDGFRVRHTDCMKKLQISRPLGAGSAARQKRGLGMRPTKIKLRERGGI
jgi:deoxyribonuclease-4